MEDQSDESGSCGGGDRRWRDASLAASLPLP